MKVYDLSCTLEKGMWYYGSPYTPFDTEIAASLERNGYIARRIDMTTHTGTHVECQAHWDYQGKAVDQYDPACFVGQAKVLRFDSNGQGFFAIGREALIAAGAEALEPGDICIVDTKWDSQKNAEKYFMESPFFTVDGARYLCEKKVKLVAFDFPMCGDPRDGMDFVPEGTPLPDTTFFNCGIPIVAALVGLSQVPDQVLFCGLPLKVAGADGAPVRAVAIEL